MQTQQNQKKAQLPLKYIERIKIKLFQQEALLAPQLKKYCFVLFLNGLPGADHSSNVSSSLKCSGLTACLILCFFYLGII